MEIGEIGDTNIIVFKQGVWAGCVYIIIVVMQLKLLKCVCIYKLAINIAITNVPALYTEPGLQLFMYLWFTYLCILLCFIVMCCDGHLLEKEESAVSTIVVRGSTDNIMDDIERAVDDGINTFRTIIKVVTCLD